MGLTTNFHPGVFTARISNRMREGNVFTGVCPSTVGGTPSPSHNTSTGPMFFPGCTRYPSHNTSTGPMSFWGGGGTPRSGMGYPLARTTGVLAMQQAVCLLHSHRRTAFFLYLCSNADQEILIETQILLADNC